jgi:hypothetical protein
MNEPVRARDYSNPPRLPELFSPGSFALALEKRSLGPRGERGEPPRTRGSSRIRGGVKRMRGANAFIRSATITPLNGVVFHLDSEGRRGGRGRKGGDSPGEGGKQAGLDSE